MDPIQVAIDVLIDLPGVISVGVHACRYSPARVTIRRFAEPTFTSYEADTIGEALNLALRELARERHPAASGG